jgi:hypothetical protein
MVNKYKSGLLLVIVILNSCITNPKLKEYSDYEYAIELKFSVFKNGPVGPFIEMAIENERNLAFFDTGVSDVALMMLKEEIEGLNLEVTGEQQFGSINQMYTVNEYLLPELIIDDKFTVNNVEVKERPPDFGNGIIMGLSAFKHYSILISYKRQKIFLYNKLANLDFIRNWTKVDIIKKDKGNGPFFYGNVAGIDRQFVFYLDTGGSFYDNKTGATLDLILTKEIRDIGVKNGLTYEFSGRKFKINRFAYLGEINKNAPIDAFIGYYFLQRYDVLLDLDNNVFYIEK